MEPPETVLTVDPTRSLEGNVETEATLPGGVSVAGPAGDHPGLVAVDPDHFSIGKELARGGMGRILDARDRRLGRNVAIKVLLRNSADARARFEREARITARLQHPSIVSVLEAGVWPNGEPFYVTKWVKGESLDKVIAGRATLEARLALLPHLIAVVDALAYAHSVGVIHRDLKPSNVLVGDFGETVVIDWGLAKELRAADDRPADGEPSPASGETIAGSIVGTPAYMPPEQARGHAVDERADVYALGVMLWHLLAGKAPYKGSTDEVLAAVKERPPAPIGAVIAGVPPDLVTIVDKATAHAADRRYASARELADDLKRFQTGQLVSAHRYSRWQLAARFLRRHRAAALATAVGLALLVAVGTFSVRRILREQAATDLQRRAAELHRGKAEELLGFMLVDLREKLKPLGKSQLLADVAGKAVAYYDERDVAMDDDDLARLALGRRNLGDVLADQGDTEQALRQYRAALAIDTDLAGRDPDDHDVQKNLAISHQRIGNIALAQGDSATALEEYRAALAIAEAVSAGLPDDPKIRRDVLVNHQKIGNVLAARGDLAGARDAYVAALAIAEALAADAGNARAQQDLAVIQDKVGNVASTQGDTAAALAAYQAALAARARMAAGDPDNAEWQRAVSLSHANVGDAMLLQGDTEGALAEYRAGLAIAEALARRDPDSADWQADLSVAQMKVADALRTRGDTTEALALYRAAVQIRADLSARDQTNLERRRDLLVAHTRLANFFLLDRLEPAEALTSYRAALAIAEELVAADPDNAGWQRDLSIGHNGVGHALRDLKQLAGSLAAFRAGLAIVERLAGAAPDDAELQRALATAHSNVGEVLLLQGDTEGALAAQEAALAIDQAEAKKDESNTAQARAVSVRQDRIGDVLLARGDPAGALAAYQASLEVAEALVKRDPANAVWRLDLALSHQHVGNAKAAAGDRPGARDSYRAGLAIAEALVAEDGANAAAREVAADLAKKTAAP